MELRASAPGKMRSYGMPSAAAFQTVNINVDQLVGFEQRFNLPPAAGEQSVIFVSAKFAIPR